MNEDKENFDLDEDNLCSIASDNDDDEEDDVFSAVQEYFLSNSIHLPIY